MTSCLIKFCICIINILLFILIYCCDYYYGRDAKLLFCIAMYLISGLLVVLEMFCYWILISLSGPFSDWSLDLEFSTNRFDIFLPSTLILWRKNIDEKEFSVKLSDSLSLSYKKCRQNKNFSSHRIKFG